ncbi:hypothetical protein [Undibacterium sp. TJN19]|uniref:hypothetical protein n=1 Tax=Undibacterium sp. TJN19 TaxID=3413055 RepID=UPI003BF2227E
MKIASSDISLSSSHIATSKSETQESLRAWKGDQRPDFEGRNLGSVSSNVQISDAARAVQASSVDATSSAKSVDDVSDNDPRVQLIKYIIELMTGKKIHLLSSSDLHTDAESGADNTPAASAPAQAAPAQKAGWGVEIDSQHSYTETEQTSFQSIGRIVTADNQEINFNLSFELNRSYHEESTSNIRLGDGKKVDPLVLNFSGNPTQLSSQKFSFDLNADGTKENISFVQGAGFLALDKNNDGKINNGSELFGPGTGNGFAELAAYDTDGNNWIDENDAIYQKLKVWTKDATGKDQLQTLKQANVGALFLGNADTPFALKNAQNVSNGQIRSSGLWLTEDGKAQSLQQIDLSV